MAAKLDYQWHLRKVMADRGLSLKILMALLDILDCTMDDLIEPVAAAGTGSITRRRWAVGAETGVGDLRPKRARIRGLERS
ncbi:hypothetical protein ACFY12_29845 [Streptomyces sp. NPDC001339]|uniref:hypothetical protein n=1 Tax=Streptomyces sp. NPDC001339 TaxID=3364563 RepID=UPI0036B95984